MALTELLEELRQAALKETGEAAVVRHEPDLAALLFDPGYAVR